MKRITCESAYTRVDRMHEFGDYLIESGEGRDSRLLDLVNTECRLWLAVATSLSRFQS